MVKEPVALTPELLSVIVDQVAARLANFNHTETAWLTPDEAAEYLRLSRRGLEDMRARGDGPRYSKVNGRVVRYRRTDLNAWLLSNGGGDE